MTLPPPAAAPPPPPPPPSGTPPSQVVDVDQLPLVKVTIATSLATVTVEACEPLDAVHRLVRRAHVDAAKRAAAARDAERRRVGF